ncbi:MAG TPA: acyltransferase family protein [Microbacterium sp.]|uniref:acyltransferase family protein n=1 Tax=Microbacterium sp. TaxID=51671 RepID=UPI002D158761|nr:acyltransferase family protein [Microbacterium sp.]HWI31637.1 acyltransferase family protein [Microbacterium sp.]
MTIVAEGPSRLGWADFARGAAILCVVYFHASLFLGVVGIDHTLGRAKLAFELFPLPAFFLIAGVFGARGILDGSFRELAAKRLIPLAYIYALWSLLRFAMFALFPALPSRDTDIPPGDPLSLVMLPVLPASLYWFLYALALFTLVVWALRRVPRWVLVAGSAVLSTLFTAGIVNTHTIAWNRIGALLFFFAIGVCFSREIVAAMRVSRPRHLAIALVAYAGIVVLLFMFRGAGRVPFVVLVGQCIGVAALLMASKQLARVPALGFVSHSGRQSLPIYLVHILVIPPIVLVLGALGAHGPAAMNIAIAIAVTAFAVVAGFGLAALATRAPWLLAPTLRVPAKAPAR